MKLCPPPAYPKISVASAEQQRIAGLTKKLHQTDMRAAAAEDEARKRDRIISTQSRELARLEAVPSAAAAPMTVNPSTAGPVQGVPEETPATTPDETLKPRLASHHRYVVVLSNFFIFYMFYRFARAGTSLWQPVPTRVESSEEVLLAPCPQHEVDLSNFCLVYSLYSCRWPHLGMTPI